MLQLRHVRFLLQENCGRKVRGRAIINILIDSKKVQAKKGETILEASRKAKIPIYRLCYCKDLNKAGVCRVCVAEVKGMPGLQPSWKTPVREGM
ncbi:MAG: (2Fe-2S)-binding protein [Eggerthellaceae bacterium]|nr:(2Fe-2S)-binding protein [Eggerthellaceae bacterium]